MAVSKLSQIANSPGNITATGVVVGVDQAGPTDYLYTPSQIGALTLAGGNLSFYQNYTTGSDSNLGTSGSPFKTMQHAANIAATFNYTGGFSPTINMQAQTDTETNDNFSQIFFPPLFPAGTQGLIQGAGVGTTILSDTDGFGGFFFTNSAYAVDGITIDSGFIAIQATRSGASVSMTFGGTLEILDSTNSGLLTPFSINNYAIGSIAFGTLTIGGTTIVTLIHSFNNSFMLATLSTVNLPATLACTFSFLECEFNSAIEWGPTTLTNGGGVTGPAVFMMGSCMITSPTGRLEDIPGVAGTSVIDSTSGIVTDSTSFSLGAGFGLRGSSRGFVDTTINPQTTSYTLALIDAGNRVEINDAAISTVTVPTNATIAFPLYTRIYVTQFGAGVVTIAGAGGVTVHNAGVLAQWGSVVLYKRGTDEWVQTNV